MKYGLVTFFLLVSCTTATAEYQELSKYESCLLDALHNSDDDVAVKILRDHCHQFRPKPVEISINEEKTVVIQKEIQQEATNEQTVIRHTESKTSDSPGAHEMTKWVIDELNKSTGIAASSFNGNIFNITEEWILTEVQFSIRDDSPGSKANTYTIKVNIPPQESRDFFLDADGIRGDEADWKIISAKGVPANRESEAAKLLKKVIPGL